MDAGFFVGCFSTLKMEVINSSETSIRWFEARQFCHPRAARWFLASLLFDPEDEGNKFFRNVD
jgi:hypothetical protein